MNVMSAKVYAHCCDVFFKDVRKMRFYLFLFFSYLPYFPNHPAFSSFYRISKLYCLAENKPF